LGYRRDHWEKCARSAARRSDRSGIHRFCIAAERAGGVLTAAEEFNRLAATFATSKGLPQFRQLTDADLTKVRSRMDELFLRWRKLPAGEILELAFLPL